MAMAGDRAIWQERARGLGSAVVVLAALLVPLCFNPWGANAFELPKAVLLRFLAAPAAVAVALAVLVFAAAPPQSRRSLPAWLLPVLALASAWLLATLFSANRLASFWGSYHRQQGLLTQVAYLALFLAAVTCLNTPRRLDRLWSALVWGSAPVVAYALIQWAGLDPLHWEVDGRSGMTSTLGRANFLASYLVLVLPLTAAAWAAWQPASRPRRLLLGMLLLAQAGVLALTAVRSAWIGLAAAAVVAGALVLCGRQPRIRPARFLRAALVAGMLLGIVLLVAGFVAGGSAAAPGVEVAERLRGAIDLSAGSTAARLTIWKATLPLVAERPLFGHGLDRLHPIFLRVYPPQLVYYQGREAMVDRAHNLWLDLAAGTGLWGVAAFAALCLAWGRQAWRGWSMAGDRRTRVLWIGLIAALVGHLVDMQFSFEVTATAALFWLVVAGGFALRRQQFALQQSDRAAQEGSAIPRRAPALLLAVLLIALGVTTSLLAVHALPADRALRRAQDETLALDDRQRYAIQAVRWRPDELAYRLALADVERQRQDYRSAATQLQIAEGLAVDDLEVLRLQAELYAAWEATDPQQQGKPEQLHRRIVAQAPTVARYHAALGLALAHQGDLTGGVQTLERAVALDATDVTAYRNLAVFYMALGRSDDADQARRAAEYWADRLEDSE